MIIIGGHGGTNVGDSLFRAAIALNHQPKFLSIQAAYDASKIVQQLNWHLRGKYPSKLNDFSQKLLNICLNQHVEILISTGIAPINQQTLLELGRRGILRVNFLTDDPWNPAHYAPWFIEALPNYDFVFSPRYANLKDLQQIGCPVVHYLPFGYDSDLFFPELSISADEQFHCPCDVLFIGGADRDRSPWIRALIRTGLNVNLYGAYWERYAETQSSYRGYADPHTLRLATSQCKVALCLVRRSNRDGHVMRSFEIPAIGACMLVEDTLEHREIFGAEGAAVIYFSTIPEMLAKAHWLIAHDQERNRLAIAVHHLIKHGQHTYHDRLNTILSFVNSESSF
jgi:spore maturation protein CgeB